MVDHHVLEQLAIAAGSSSMIVGGTPLATLVVLLAAAVRLGGHV